MEKIILGKKSEEEACNFLEKKGLSLLAKNYRSKLGEIDLIMQDADTIVFVEVRKKSYQLYGSALDSVDLTKQRKIIKTALYYLQNKNLIDKVDCRFDIVGITHEKFEWIQDAFALEDTDL